MTWGLRYVVEHTQRRPNTTGLLAFDVVGRSDKSEKDIEYTRQYSPWSYFALHYLLCNHSHIYNEHETRRL